MNFILDKLAKMMLKPQHSRPNSISSNISIDENYLRDIVAELSFERVYKTPPNIKARDIIVRELVKMERQPMLGDPPFDNIIVGNPVHAVKLVGAHYDSVPGSPGADDNASAVAVMLAVAKATKGVSGICFVAFNSEEYNLAGSRAFVDNWKPNQLKQVHILEMVGYCKHTPDSQINPLPFLPLSNVGDFIGVVGNNNAFVKHVIEQAGVSSVPAVGLSIPSLISLDAAYKLSPDIFRSDHANFWDADIPAVMWTDTSNFRNPNYHGPNDTPDTLDYGFMAEVAKILVQLVSND
jgi:Zn-dependent M28 family amino/carboxypeptidase